jgi:hypothetical protein
MTVRISKGKTIVTFFVSLHFFKNCTTAFLTFSAHSFTSASVSAERVNIISLLDRKLKSHLSLNLVQKNGSQIYYHQKENWRAWESCWCYWE